MPSTAQPRARTTKAGQPRQRGQGRPGQGRPSLRTTPPRTSVARAGKLRRCRWPKDGSTSDAAEAVLTQTTMSQPEVKIDLDGLGGRIVNLPVPESRYSPAPRGRRRVRLAAGAALRQSRRGRRQPRRRLTAAIVARDTSSSSGPSAPELVDEADQFVVSGDLVPGWWYATATRYSSCPPPARPTPTTPRTGSTSTCPGPGFRPIRPRSGGRRTPRRAGSCGTSSLDPRHGRGAMGRRLLTSTVRSSSGSPARTTSPT